jgi:hypothetical protein
MSADCIKIDGVRWGVGAQIMQKMADMLGALMPTAKLRCLQWQQAKLKLDPITASMVGFPISQISFTANMRKYSAAIDAAIAAAGGLGPNEAAPTGKPWIIANILANPNAQGHGDNFGWFVNVSGNSWKGVAIYPADAEFLNLRVIQQQGTAHDLNQSDYSETPIFVSRDCVVDGQPRDLAEILVDPVLSALVSSEGPLKVIRQPGVPVAACPVGSSSMPTHVVAALAAGGAICGMPPAGTGTSSSAPAVWPYVLTAIGVGAAATWWWKRYGKRQFGRR